MANDDKPKPNISAGLRAFSEPVRNALPNWFFETMWVIQFCYKCKNANCNKVFPLETGVHTTTPERAQADLAEFAKGFEEPKTIECLACHEKAEYHPQDVGFDILEKLEK